MNALERAIKHAGTVSRLAHILGVRQSAVSNWKSRGDIPADQCPTIETATAGAVRCEELRPDVTWQRDTSGAVTGYVVPVQQQEPRDVA